MSSPLVAIYADESCLGNGRDGENPGGAGGVLELMHRGELTRRDFWVSEPGTTNNRMALRSAIEALRLLSAKGRRCRVLFVSDSRYLVDGNSDWIYGWIARGWKRKAGVLENEALWRELAELRRDHDTQWSWVRGHHGHPQNEYANLLATRAAKEQTSSGGPVASGFDAWLEAQRASKGITLDPDPFPDAARYRPARPLPDAPAGALFDQG